VSAGIVPLGTGSDGAGSARIPAAWCRLWTLKPGRGALTLPGGRAEHAGLAATPADLALYHAVVAAGRVRSAVADGAPDPRDPEPRDPEPRDPEPRDPGDPVHALWWPTLGQPGIERYLDDATLVRALAAAEGLRAAGLIDLDRNVPDARLSDPADAWRRRRRSPADPEPPGVTGDRRILDELLRATTTPTLIVSPVTPAGPHGHDGPGDHLSVALTWALNLTGHPALVMPLNAAGESAPLQVIAAAGDEDLLLGLARRCHARFEQAATP
jgi:Asp-tRNA(Asn)/Glu-tRNA(Gln) amidotransferase A subunit family amidase